MRKHGQNNIQTQPDTADYITVAIAEDIEQAQAYRDLLRKNDIPAAVKKEIDLSGEIIKVLLTVPEDYLDEAHVVIESRNACDDLFDFGLEGNDWDDSQEADDDDEI